MRLFLARAGSTSWQRSLPLWFSVSEHSPQLVSVFSLLSLADPSPLLPHALLTSSQRGMPPSTFLILPSHQFCARQPSTGPSVHYWDKKLALRRKEVWVWCFVFFFLLTQLIFCQFNDLWGQISICVGTREGTGASSLLRGGEQNQPLRWHPAIKPA